MAVPQAVTDEQFGCLDRIFTRSAARGRQPDEYTGGGVESAAVTAPPWFVVESWRWTVQRRAPAGQEIEVDFLRAGSDARPLLFLSFRQRRPRTPFQAHYSKDAHHRPRNSRRIGRELMTIRTIGLGPGPSGPGPEKRLVVCRSERLGRQRPVGSGDFDGLSLE